MSSTRGTVAIAVAALLIGIPAGYALAQSADDTSPEGGDPPQSVLESIRNDPQIAARVGTTPITLDALRERYAELEALQQQAAAHPEDKNVIGNSSPAPLVKQCRSNPNSADLCGIALAIDDGKLEPGDYTDAELQDAVRAAGYEWTPAPDGGN